MVVNEYKVARSAHTRVRSDRMFLNPEKAIAEAKKSDRGMKVFRLEDKQWKLYWKS